MAKKIECWECGERIKRNQRSAKFVIFDDPWDQAGQEVRLHAENEDEYGRTCVDKLTDTGWADFRYFTCAECERLVIRQCPKNGWRSYVKMRGDEEICVACYQKTRLEKGERREAFEGESLPGDFHNHDDIKKNGWLPVINRRYVHITNYTDVKLFSAGALALMDKGKKVLVDYDSMAYGGSEGYISLYCKEGASDAKADTNKAA